LIADNGKIEIILVNLKLLMTAPTSIRQKAITLLQQLPDDQLVQAVEFLEELSHQTLQSGEVASNSPQEDTLLHIIQRRLPLGDQARLDALRQRSEAGNITDVEYQELLMYVDRVEQQDADRAAALIQLAQLRQVDLKTLITKFLPTHQTI
jgi:hypothetical protein